MKINIDIEELDNGHGKLVIQHSNAFTKESEFPSMEEALEEAYKTLARERVKWRS